MPRRGKQHRLLVTNPSVRVGGVAPPTLRTYLRETGGSSRFSGTLIVIRHHQPG